LVSDSSQLIGRSEHADITLLEPTVSRQHATIVCQDGVVLLKDLSSKHGTFVNSKRVAAVRLKVGDIVVFGLSTVLRLEESDKPVPQAEPMKAASGPADRGDAEANVVATAVRTVTVPPRGHRRPTEGISEPRRLEAQMAKMRKLAGAGGLCVQRLPEIQVRLGDLHSALERLSSDPVRGSGVASAVACLDATLASLGQLVEALGLAPRPQLEMVPLARLVARAARLVEPEILRRDLRLVVSVEPSLTVSVDTKRMVTAISEILRNAARRGPPGSTVEVHAARSGREVVLSVADHGERYSAEVLEAAFDPVVTQEEAWQALGLGLFEAREIVMTLGGALFLESQEGMGGAVRVMLPAGEG
jgi:hypothetical protein